MNIEDIKPINNRVLVRRVQPPKVSAGGIVIPDTADKGGMPENKAMRGRVLALSPGKRMKDGSLRPHDFAVGDVIVFERWSDTDLKEIEPDLAMVEGDDVLGVES